MSNIISFTEAHTKKLNEEKAHFEVVMKLVHMLHAQNPEEHPEIICKFLEDSKENDKFLSLSIKLIATHSELKSHTEQILKTLPYESREKIVFTISEVWPKETDTVNRLKHILRLAHFCSRQVPRMPFFKIIPRSIVIKFLMSEKQK